MSNNLSPPNGPGRPKDLAKRQAVLEDSGRRAGGAGLEAPGAVAGGFILEERPGAGGGLEATLRPELERVAGHDFSTEPTPIEAEVRTDARVLCDPQVVGEEELIDGFHEREKGLWTTLDRTDLHGR